MADEASYSPDYRGRTPKRGGPPQDAEFLRWRALRMLFRAGVVLVLMPVTFYFGPNLITFGKLTRLSAADFITDRVESTLLPTVRAMKEYQRDMGRLPDRMEDLVPKYLASISNDAQGV